MVTFTSKSGNKKITITENGYGGYFAKVILVSNSGIGLEEDLIQMKSFNTFRSAEKWTIKNL